MMECLDQRQRKNKINNHYSSMMGAFQLFICMLLVSFSHINFAADQISDDENTSNQENTQSKNDQDDQPINKSESVDTLPEVSVTDTRVKEESGINPTLPITTITSEQLQRTQPSNIFEAVKSAPGVSITGGPRPSGMAFSIRGYTDNEDVMVKVDGAPKGFEKYRMGGTFVEPELLKSIEIQRGPQITSGSGSLGGTIIAQTKNAADLLKPGQKFGAKAKFGYGNNNDEYSRSYMMYARPEERIDILFNYSNRQANNITLANGDKLDSSAIQSISQLLKVSIFPREDLELSTSLVTFDDSGLQPYDATGGQPGTFGTVIRSIDDFSWTQTMLYTPDHPWVNLKAVLGGGHTKLHDLLQPGKSSINPCNVSTCTNMNDYYDYKTKTVDLSNISTIFKADSMLIAVLTGYQYNESERDVERFLENPASPLASGYPNGFNPSAPPGKRSYNAFYIQPHFQIGQVSIKPGYRRDDYKIEADGGTLDLLAPFKQASKNEFTEETWSLGLAYDFFPRASPKQLTVYSNYGQGFRPALIDESFTQGTFSRCRRLGALLIPGVSMPDGPPSGICGDLYQSQTSESTEVGMSYQDPHLMGTDIGLTSKINFYHIYTSHLLSSLRENDDRSITQKGWERRNGIEVEGFVQYHGIYMRGAYSRINGNLFDGGRFVPLYTIPGNTLNINLGASLTKTLDFNVTYRKISDRNIIVGGGTTTDYVFGTQDGYEIWNAGVHWQATPQLGMRLIGENLTNKEYRLDAAMGGLGIFAPGKNLKFFVELMY
jgi:hemoglobin/transferrin/lactoferrin receptor protein